jgi:hypothetical protein
MRKGSFSFNLRLAMKPPGRDPGFGKQSNAAAPTSIGALGSRRDRMHSRKFSTWGSTGSEPLT